jgi:hypothetical protein
MIPGKTLAAIGGAEAIGLAVAVMNDYPTISIAIIGIGSAVATAGVGIYSAWRAAKHKADLQDAPLVQVRLAAAEARIDDLEKANLEWQRLYEAQKNLNHMLDGDPTTPRDLSRQSMGMPQLRTPPKANPDR